MMKTGWQWSAMFFLAILFLGGCATGMKFVPEEELKPSGIGFGEEVLIERPAWILGEGEKLTYEVSWLRIPVGQIILENHGLEKLEGEEVYHLSFSTLSNKFLSNFFKIEDTVHSWVSREGGYPLRFEKNIKEGHYRKQQVVRYDHENLTATYQTKRGITTMPVPPNVQDVFSLLYWVRQQDLGIGRQLEFDVNADEKNWVVRVEVKGKGVFKTGPMGKVKAFALSPTATHEGEPLKKGEMEVWMTADRRRIPLAFDVRAKIFGSIKAVLTEAVLPPLPEYRFLPPGEGEDLIEAICRTGAWLNGLTQAVARPGF